MHWTNIQLVAQRISYTDPTRIKFNPRRPLPARIALWVPTPDPQHTRVNPPRAGL